MILARDLDFIKLNYNSELIPDRLKLWDSQINLLWPLSDR